MGNHSAVSQPIVVCVAVDHLNFAFEFPRIMNHLNFAFEIFNHFIILGMGTRRSFASHGSSPGSPTTFTVSPKYTLFCSFCLLLLKWFFLTKCVFPADLSQLCRFVLKKNGFLYRRMLTKRIFAYEIGSLTSFWRPLCGKKRGTFGRKSNQINWCEVISRLALNWFSAGKWYDLDLRLIVNYR